MKNHTTPLYRQLAAAGIKAPTVTPGAAANGTTFNLISLPPVTEDMRNYVLNFLARVSITLDSDSAGNAIAWDAFYKGVSAVRLYSPILGEVYQTQHTRGAVLGHLIQVVANGYQYPQPARAQIPTDTDADYTVDLYYVIPMAHECFVKPHETAQFTGLFEQGELEVRIAETTVYNGDYAGAVIKAPTTVRAWMEYIPSPDNFIGVPFQWREYQIPGNSTEFILRGVGGSSGLKGILNNGCGLAGLYWLTDATGIGLGGADGVDEITRVDLPFRNQESIDSVDPFFLALRRQVGNRVGPVAGNGTTIVHDGSGWPYTMAATPNNALANAQAMILPLVSPGRQFETSKAQHVRGDLRVNFSFGSTPAPTHRFVTHELLQFDEPQLIAITRAMGLDPNAVTVDRKRTNGPATAKQLRYTRVMLNG
jgi:hypothetical protein